jgi:hypothetical protein
VLEFERLSEAVRKRVLAAVGKAKTNDEAVTVAKREIARHGAGVQKHHAISRAVHKELENHPFLKGKYEVRDKRFEAIAGSTEAHRGYQSWHRDLDSEVVAWIRNNRQASPSEFESWLKQRYAKPDLKDRFPDGLNNYAIL